jgi:hypothetical protein
MTSTIIMSLWDRTDNTSGSPVITLTACRLLTLETKIFRHRSLVSGNLAPLSYRHLCQIVRYVLSVNMHIWLYLV